MVIKNIWRQVITHGKMAWCAGKCFHHFNGFWWRSKNGSLMVSINVSSYQKDPKKWRNSSKFHTVRTHSGRRFRQAIQGTPNWSCSRQCSKRRHFLSQIWDPYADVKIYFASKVTIISLVFHVFGTIMVKMLLFLWQTCRKKMDVSSQEIRHGDRKKHHGLCHYY